MHDTCYDSKIQKIKIGSHKIHFNINSQTHVHTTRTDYMTCTKI